MNSLQVFMHDNVEVTDSREVARMADKRHADLLESIATYIDYLTNGKFRSLDFFIPSTYVDGKGETRPNYLITRKGCEFIANKLTGQKGTLFTAAYIDAFHAMEARIQGGLENLSPNLRVLIEMELEQKRQAKALTAVNNRIDSIADAITLDTRSWREECRKLIARIARSLGGNDHIRDVQAEIYRLLDERAGVSLETRLTNMRRRMAEEGVCKSKRDKLNKVDVIGGDRKLIEIYVSIVREMAVKYLDTQSEEAI